MICLDGLTTTNSFYSLTLPLSTEELSSVPLLERASVPAVGVDDLWRASDYRSLITRSLAPPHHNVRDPTSTRGRCCRREFRDSVLGEDDAFGPAAFHDLHACFAEVIQKVHHTTDGLGVWCSAFLCMEDGTNRTCVECEACRDVRGVLCETHQRHTSHRVSSGRKGCPSSVWFLLPAIQCHQCLTAGRWHRHLLRGDTPHTE